jgi:hypothetical protein
MNRYFCLLCLLALTAILGGNAGCNRQYYRTKADHEVYSVIKQGNNDPRWKVDDPHITPYATSRMFDPYHPDCEPMPTDDAAAHQKMHSVAGKKASARWHEHGDTQSVENPAWRQYLLVNEKGEVPLDKDKAVELARLHSPEYQTALENLYLAAMKVSQERFQYNVQFFGGDSLLYSVPKRGAGGPTLKNSASFGAEQALATGGTWVVDLANNITWSLTGAGSWRAQSLINVGITQPLLRGANRKVVLEKLTQTERDFLEEVRKVVLFQQGHYTKLVTGTVPRNSGASGAGGGFYRLLESQIQIQTQRQNIIGLEENLNRFNEMFEAGQVTDVYQVKETQQSLLSSQSRLLEQINQYQARVESYISSLGLPPDLKVSISDPLLEQFQFTSPTLTTLMEDVGDFLAMIRKKDQPLAEGFRTQINDVIRRTEGEIAVLEQDLEMLQKSVPERIQSLKSLEAFLAGRIENGERVDKSIYDIKEFEDRIAKLRTVDIPRNLKRLRAAFILIDLIVNLDEPVLRQMIREHSFDPSVLEAWEELKLNEVIVSNIDTDLSVRQRELEKLTEELQSLRTAYGNDASPQALQDAKRIEKRIENLNIINELRQKDEYRDWIRRVVSAFQYELVSLSLMQTRTRLDAMTLVPVSVSPEEAFQTASEHRLDWMNRKAQLVDAWRQIDFTADDLKGAFGLRLDGALGTIDKRGVRLDADTGKLDVRFEWESPLTRYNEMMTYRKSQIDYQKARRDYYTYVDSVQAEVRNTLRDVQMSLINFEINRNAVLVGTVRVDVMQLRMEQPPQRGGRIDTNTSDQLIRALEGLMNSQNNLLNTWVAYQTQRMLLDYNMGTMTLDEQGRWIEPGVIGSAITAPPEVIPSIPMAIPVPILEVPRPGLNRRYVEK